MVKLEDYLIKDELILLVLFVRSGNSFESLVVVEVVN